MARVKINRDDRYPMFLSDKVQGSVKVDTPNGCAYDSGEGPEFGAEGAGSGGHPGSNILRKNFGGNRTGE